MVICLTKGVHFILSRGFFVFENQTDYNNPGVQ